jgi:hypothetical protein
MSNNKFSFAEREWIITNAPTKTDKELHTEFRQYFDYPELGFAAFRKLRQRLGVTKSPGRPLGQPGEKKAQ